MVLAFNKETKVFELISTQEKEPPMERDESALAVLRALNEINATGVVVPNTSSGPRNGIGLLKDQTGMKPAEIKDALSRLFLWKAVGEVEYQKSDRHSGLRLVLTDAGRELLVQEVEGDEGAKAERGQRAKGVDELPEHLQ
jgi:hypothetical protein